jgi:hypothetical protein
MSIESFILIAATLLTLSSMLYIPKNKRRTALLSYSAFSATTWLVTILLAYNNKVTYPVRIFTRSTKITFIPEFLLYPMAFTWFILLYPNDKVLIRKVLHFIIFISIPVMYIYFISVYTNLENYIGTTAIKFVLSTYVNFFIQFRLCQLYVGWFFSKKHLLERGN